jgi:hypothetical protein
MIHVFDTLSGPQKEQIIKKLIRYSEIGCWVYNDILDSYVYGFFTLKSNGALIFNGTVLVDTTSSEILKCRVAQLFEKIRRLNHQDLLEELI